MRLVEDSQIIDLFFERSEQAIGELASKYGAAVSRIATNLLGDRLDAEECVNDAYLGVWNSIPPHRPEPLAAYVCRIARNLAVSRLRSKTAQKRGSGVDLVLDELSEVLPASTDVEAELEAKELAEAVDRFLSKLPYDDRYLFVRRYWYADDLKQIAGGMRIQERQVSQRLFRLRERLRKSMKKEGLLYGP